MTRLPSIVVCSSCGTQVHATQARRKVIAWARPGKGGTLSSLKGMQTTDAWLCDPCLTQQLHGQQSGSLFEEAGS